NRTETGVQCAVKRRAILTWRCRVRISSVTIACVPRVSPSAIPPFIDAHDASAKSLISDLLLMPISVPLLILLLFLFLQDRVQQRHCLLPQPLRRLFVFFLVYMIKEGTIE